MCAIDLSRAFLHANQTWAILTIIFQHQSLRDKATAVAGRRSPVALRSTDLPIRRKIRIDSGRRDVRDAPQRSAFLELTCHVSHGTHVFSSLTNV